MSPRDRTPVAAGLLVRDESLLICQRREDQPMPLKWEFPGGKIDPGEDPRAALRRELREELAIDATIGIEVLRLEYNYPSALVELHFFLVTRWHGEIQNRIFRAVQWVHRAELPQYDFLEADRSLIDDLAAGRVPTNG